MLVAYILSYSEYALTYMYLLFARKGEPAYTYCDVDLFGNPNRE